MTYEEFNRFCNALPATSYVVQWGNSHVWKVGDKVFAVGGWEKINQPAFTFKVSELNYNVLCEQPGFRPAPYLASRGMKWIQQYSTVRDNLTKNNRSNSVASNNNGGNNGGSNEETLKYYLKESHRIVASGLSKKKQKELGLLVTTNP